MSVKLLTEHHLVFLSLKTGCTGSSESTIVKMPHCQKSHFTAQIYSQRIPSSPVSKGQSGPTQVRFSFRTDQCLASRFVTWYLDIGFSKQSVFSPDKALFLTSCSSTNLQEKKKYILKPTSYRSPYIFTLVQKVNHRVYKIHVFLSEARLCRNSASYFI